MEQQQTEENLSLFPTYGDCVLLYGAHDAVVDVLLQHGGICSTRFGLFKHEDIVNTSFGSKVYDRRSKKWMAVLRPAAAVAALALSRRTQILYHADVALALSLLEASPGKVICEAGSGSGCFSRFLAEAVSPSGRVFTFEFHGSRYQEAKEDFQRLQLQDVVTCFHRDVCCEGFSSSSSSSTRSSSRAAAAAAEQHAAAGAAEKGRSRSTAAAADCSRSIAMHRETSETASISSSAAAASEKTHDDDASAASPVDVPAAAAAALPLPKTVDAIFLDLPTPWLALDHVQTTLRSGGRLVVFSPCIEQVQKTCAGLREGRFHSIQTYEILLKPWGVWTAKPTARGPAEEVTVLAATAAFERSRTAGDSLSNSGNCSSTSTSSRDNSRGSVAKVEDGGDERKMTVPAACAAGVPDNETNQRAHREPVGASDTVPPQTQQKQKGEKGKAARARANAGGESKSSLSSQVSVESALASFPVLLSHFLKQPLMTGGKIATACRDTFMSSTCQKKKAKVDAAERQQEQPRQDEAQQHEDGKMTRQQHPDAQSGMHDGEETPEATDTSELCTDMGESEISVINVEEKGPQKVRQALNQSTVEMSNDAGDPKSKSECATPKKQSLADDVFTPLIDTEYTHYPLPMRGHTGYLTVAIQP